MNQEKTSHPGAAAVLSFIFNGLGQLYNGHIFKGLVIIFLSVIGMIIVIIGAVLLMLRFSAILVFSGQIILGSLLFLAGLIFICILGIYSILDAYRSAAKK